MAETIAQIAQHYSAMGESVDLINEIIASTEKDEESIYVITRNIRHLEKMLTKDFWTSEDLSDANAAVTAGNAYIAEILKKSIR